MSDRFKQRLVGALVLIALAVVFLPVLFNMEPRQPVDESSRIPPAPEIEPAQVAEPGEPEVTSEPPAHEDVFQPEAESAREGESGTIPSEETAPGNASKREADTARAEETADADRKEAPETIPEADRIRETAAETPESPMTETPREEPGLAESGLPQAWVVQAASYGDEDSAQSLSRRLQEADFKAFVRSATVDGRTVHRVYVGPLVLKRRAEEQKERIDASLGVDSLIVPYEP